MQKEQYWLITYKASVDINGMIYQQTISGRIIDFLVLNMDIRLLNQLQITKDDFDEWQHNK